MRSPFWRETGANILWTNTIKKMSVSPVNYSSKQCWTAVDGGKLLEQGRTGRFWARGQRDQHSIITLKTLISSDQRLRSSVPHRKNRSGFILFFFGAGSKLNSCTCKNVLWRQNWNQNKNNLEKFLLLH